MKKSNNTSLQVTSNTGVLRKISNFIRKLFCKKDINYISSVNTDKNSFFQSVKFEEDPDKSMLLKIQDDLEKNGINKKNAYELTKNLTELQKKKLLDLYKEQISKYETSISNHKNRILAMRKNIV